MMWMWLVLPAALIWLGILLLPSRPWSARERLDSDGHSAVTDLSDVTVLIPARNEAEGIRAALAALRSQGAGLNVVLVDDESTDGTAEIAADTLRTNLRVISGTAKPAGWTGKLWALEQGRGHVKTPLTLLMDADIELAPGVIAALRDKMRQDHIQFISLMAALRMKSFWEKLLIPAFVYFFKLLYPFRLSNNPGFPRIAAAAGGCIMVETGILDEMGGFQRIKDALIDDCALAGHVKARGYWTWIGLTHSVRSTRPYDTLDSLWNMVARTAFTQLRYSTLMLLLTTGIFITGFWLPVAGLASPAPAARGLAVLALCAMALSYMATLKFYRMSSLWGLAMPLIGTLFLAMTWSSAVRYWRGERSEWKGRIYSKALDTESCPGNGGV